MAAARTAYQRELFQAAQQNDFQSVGDYLQVLFDEAVDAKQLKGPSSRSISPKAAVVKTLLEPKSRNTLLHYACDNGNIDACKFLLMCDGMADAFLNEPNAFGHTPLFYAASSGKLPLVKWLISNGADIDMDYSDRDDVAPRDGDLGIFTPLQIACFKGHEDVVNFLVECNASLAGTARNGKTPLHFASSQNHKHIVKILMEAGADVHACDDEGKTPVDVATASLLPVLLPDEHGGACDDEEESLETNRMAALDDDDDQEDGFGNSSLRTSIEAMRTAFGADITRQIRHKSWKNRVQAINDATVMLQNTSNKSFGKQFVGGCELIVIALQDAVSQVVSSGCTGLLKAVFNSAMGGGIKDFHTAKFHQDHPTIKKISDLLLLRGAGSNEKDASEAVASLLFLICKSADITRYLTLHISGIMQFTPSAAVVTTPSKAGDSNTSTSATSWRLQLVAIKILNTVASQYRLDEASSGLNFADAIKISTTSLENASVHVRSAAIDLLVQCLLIRCEQSDVVGSIDAIFEQMKSWSEGIFKQHNLILKPSIQAKINNGLKNALQQSKRLNTSATPTSPGGTGGQSVKVALPTLAAGGAASPRSKGAQKDDDLPYAEPIQDQFKDEAASVLACFGEKLARCLFSNAWAPRVEALSLLQFQVETKHIQFRDLTRSEAVLEAMQKALLLSLQDRVNSVYEAGVALLMEFAIALNTGVASSPSQKGVAQDLLRPMIPRLLTKLGDTKARLHITTEDALLLLSRQEASLGPEYLVDEMIACDRNTSIQSLSPTYLANKLTVISKLLLEFRVKEDNDQAGELPIKVVLQPALQVFEHRDPNVRQISLQIVGDAVKTARAAAMPFLDALARASRQKIIAKLVEKGVLEADLLMDEVDDFDIASNDPPLRPGTSSGFRPPTASGSSTKHRPALSNTSLSASASGQSASSGASSMASVQAPALPYGTALTKEQETTFACLIECFGEELVRCLLDKAWAQREAAIREIERLVVCTANGKLPADKALAKTSDTLRILSQCVELGLNDTVARVFQCTLRLCQLIATEFVAMVQSSDGDDIIDSFLDRTVSAALQKFGDTKQRLRADCFTLLYSLASLNHIGQKRMCRILTSKFTHLMEASPTSAFASSPLVGAELFKLFAVLIRDAYTNTSLSSASSRPDLQEILQLMTSAFENKHVDVRNAAIEAYTTIYEVTNGGSSVPDIDLQHFLSQVKPAIRETITRKVVQISKLALSGIGDQSGEAGGHEIDSSRQQPLALDINKLRHVCSNEITELLTSASAGQRCAGVDKLMTLFIDSPRNPQFKGAWEISCLLAKQLLLDGTPGVCLAAFQLLWLIVDPPTPTGCEYAIPWGEWGVHLILGSTIRSVVQQSANESVRVRTQVKAILQLVASKSSAGRNAVCNAILSAPEQRDISNEPSKRVRKIALCKLRWQWVLRLEMMQKLIADKGTSAHTQNSNPAPLARRKSSSGGSKSGTGDVLSIENVVPFLGSCMVHPSPLVRGGCRKTMAMLKAQLSSAADEVTRFVQQECSASLQRRLQPLLTDDDDGDDNNTAHADHFNADDTTVVRGSRASHVRRISALRPPRSVPVEEKSLEVDVFPPPHSAPGKSRRSLQADDDDEFGDYVVKPMAGKDTAEGRQQQQSQAPIWLSNATQKNPYGDSAKRGGAADGSPEMSQFSSSILAVGGGAANLIKVRRKSSMRSNNGDEDEHAPTASGSRAPRGGY